MDIVRAEQEQIAKGHAEVSANPLKGTRIGKEDILAELNPNDLEKYSISRGRLLKTRKRGISWCKVMNLKKRQGRLGILALQK